MTIQIQPPAVVVAARRVLAQAARGVYQRALAAGRAAWSGAGLSGAARTYGGRYARSRAGLLVRADLALRDWAPAALVTALVLREGTWRRELAVLEAGRAYLVHPPRGVAYEVDVTGIRDIHGSAVARAAVAIAAGSQRVLHAAALVGARAADLRVELVAGGVAS